MPSVNQYAESVKAQLRAVGINAETDLSGNTLQKKVRNAQIALCNFTIVVGAEEASSQTVNIRNRDDQATQQRGDVIPLTEAIEKLVKLRDERRLENKI
jgi:threonyl-tRNA synthetase